MKSKIITSLLAVCTIVFFGFLLRQCDIDFNDYPALLMEIRKDGTVVLETYDGIVTGQLKGVNWRTDKVFLDKVNEVVGKAKIDKVSFSRGKNNQLQIWYQTIDGGKSLNKEIQNMSSSVGFHEIKCFLGTSQ